MINKTIYSLIVIGVTFSAWPLFANGAVLFQDDFDNNCSGTACNVTGATMSVPTGWTQWHASETTATADGTTHYSGEISSNGRGGSGKSLKLWRHSGSFGDYSGPLALYFENPGNHIFMRYYQKLPVAFNGTDQAFKGWRMNLEGGGEIYHNFNYCDGDCRNNGDWTIYDGLSTVTVLNNADLRAIWDGNWHSIEWELGLGNNTLKLWIDGVQKYSSTNKNWNSSSDFAFMQHFPVGNTYTHNGMWQSSWQALEVDDFVISTTYVGPDGSEGDSVAPLAPSGLVVL